MVRFDSLDCLVQLTYIGNMHLVFYDHLMYELKPDCVEEFLYTERNTLLMQELLLEFLSIVSVYSSLKALLARLLSFTEFLTVCSNFSQCTAHCWFFHCTCLVCSNHLPSFFFSTRIQFSISSQKRSVFLAKLRQQQQ